MNLTMVYVEEHFVYKSCSVIYKWKNDKIANCDMTLFLPREISIMSKQTEIWRFYKKNTGWNPNKIMISGTLLDEIYYEIKLVIYYIFSLAIYIK